MTDLFLDLVQSEPVLQDLKLQSPGDSSQRGAQLSFSHSQAWGICRALHALGVMVDYRICHQACHGVALMDKSHSVVRLAPVLLSGLLFGLGLTVSGMINPAKVIGFLDIAGQWDPTLLFVMGASLSVTMVSFRLVMKQGRPLLEEMFHLPSKKDLDARLILGTVLFGVGWGLAGFCPGPALTAVVFLDSSVVLFVAAMVGGMLLHFILLERSEG